jgi:hypothetical protein
MISKINHFLNVGAKSYSKFGHVRSMLETQKRSLCHKISLIVADIGHHSSEKSRGYE